MEGLKFILASLGILILLVGCGAQENEKNPPLLSAPVRDVAIFKNGYGFFTREGEADLNDGWCVTNSVPAASLGTFWVYSPNENVAVDQVITGKPHAAASKTGEPNPSALVGKTKQSQAV